MVVAETTQGTFLNHVVSGDHRFLADEPESIGGFDAGPAPYDLVAAGLGACTSMTLRLYADRKSIPVDRFIVEVGHDKVYVDDQAEAESSAGAKIDEFRRTIYIDGDIDEAQEASLLRIADRCPVHRTLERDARIVTDLG